MYFISKSSIKVINIIKRDPYATVSTSFYEKFKTSMALFSFSFVIISYEGKCDKMICFKREPS